MYVHRLAIKSRNDFDHFSTSFLGGRTVEACSEESVCRRRRNRNRCFMSSRALQRKNKKKWDIKDKKAEQLFIQLSASIIIILSKGTAHWGSYTKKGSNLV